MGVKLKLIISNEKDPVEWDQQASNLGGAFFHCHASAIYNTRLIGGEPLFVEARDESNCCVGIAVGTIVTSKIWPFSRLCRIASFPATPIAAGDRDIEIWLLENIECQLKQSGVFKIVFASYHSHNSNDLLPLSGYNITVRNEYEIDLTREENVLFEALKSKKRNHVRRAEKNGVLTQVVNSSEAVELVEKLHNLSMKRRGLPLSNMREDAVATRRILFDSGRIRVLVSFLEEEPVCAYLLGVFNGHAYGLRSGSSDIGNRKGAPVHLRWTAIEFFKKEGFDILSFGGAHQEESGVRKFKQELGTIESPQPSGHKIISNFGASLDFVRRRLRP